MAQQIIDVGNVANDGQGDPLRTAFIKTNQNFTELYNAGGVSGIANGNSNITIAENSTINMAVDGTPDVITVLTTGATVLGNMIANTFCAVGNVYSTYYYGNGSTLSGLNNQNAANLTGTTLSANVVNSSLTNLGVLSVLNVGGNINVSGNVVSNARVTAGNITSNNTLAVGGSATFGGGITAGGVISTTGNVVANNIIGTFVFGSISTAGNIIGANILTSGQISAAGNVTGNYFLGNGALLTGIAGAYSNANVAAYLPTYTGALTASTLSLSGAVLSPLTTTANITGNYFIGNGALLTGVLATGVGTLPSLSVTGNAVVGNLSTSGIISAASMNSSTLSLSGNLLSPLSMTNNITTTGNLTVNSANIINDLNMGGDIDMQSNDIINANVANAVTYYGNNLELGDHAWIGTSLTSGFPAGNVIWSSADVTATANLNAGNAIITNNVLVSGYVSAGGNISSAGSVSAVGNVSGTNLQSTGLITAGGNVTAANVQTSGLITASGNIFGANISTPGIISAGANIVTAGFFVGNLIGNTIGCIAVPGSNTEVLYNLDGNVGASAAFTFDEATNNLDVGGNVSIDFAISAAGNVSTGNFFIGNGAFLTGITGTVANVLSSLTVTGNTLSGNFLANSGIVSAAGNVTGGNLLTVGQMSAQGNVSGNVVIASYLSVSGNVLGNLWSDSDITTNASITGDFIEANVLIANVISADLDVTVGAGASNVFIDDGNVIATGNITSGNLKTNNLLVVASLGADPTGVTGAIYFNTGNNKFRGFDGTNWTNLN